MDTGISQVVKDGNGNALLFTAIAAAAIANIMPTPADYFYFKAQSRDKEKLEKGLITPKQYWTRDIAGYYLYTAGWYTAMFLTIQALGGTYKNNSRILLALLSGGLIIGVANQNIKRDEQIRALEKQQKNAGNE